MTWDFYQKQRKSEDNGTSGREKDCQPRILYIMKISFKNGGERKIFLD